MMAQEKQSSGPERAGKGRRQRVRKALLLLSLLLFPITLYYFSPAIVLSAAAEGVVNASLIVFGAMFVGSLFVGRLWCGWACPAGGLQAFGAAVNGGPFRRRRGDWLKWAIWIPWLGGIVALAVAAGGYQRIDPFYQLEGGLTLAQPLEGGGPPWFLIYYIIVALFLGLALALGRRAGCHTLCWMAPFMILGRKLRNLGRWPALRLRAEPDRCADCRRCSRDCPMSLDVNAMVRRGDMEDAECILCGTCVDNCPQQAIRFSFSGGR
jgi:ferredoxin-type protein NapH